MSGAVLLAFASGVATVLAAWEALGAVDARVLARWLAPLRRDREPSGEERRRLALVGAGTLLAGGWLVAGLLPGLVAAAAGPWLAGRVLAARRARRRAALGRAAAPVARSLADALSAGRSVTGAIAVAGAAPSGAAGSPPQLRAAAASMALGEPVEVVLERLRREASDPAWDTLVAAILLQRDAGGDLAGLLRDLAERLEEARRTEADARSATAQARFTAWLVAALPAGAAVLAELASPGWLASLAAEPLTAVLLAASLALQLVAVLVIRRVAKVAG